MGSPGFMSSLAFYKHWGNIRLTSCFCGIARLDALYCVLHALGQHQTNVLLPWDRPKSCFLWCFTFVKAISDQRIAFVVSPEFGAFYRVLHALGQYQTSGVLLWDRPDSFLNALSGYHGNTDRYLGALGVSLCIVFYMLRSCVRGRLGQIQYAYLCMCSLCVGLRVSCVYAWAATDSQPSTQPTAFWQPAVGVIGKHATQRYPKLTSCFCGIAQMHAFYDALHALGEYQSNELLLWHSPNSCSLS